MSTADTTKYTARKYIFQVNSSSNFRICYFIIMSNITTSGFFICRVRRDRPRVKMRVCLAEDHKVCASSRSRHTLGHACICVSFHRFKLKKLDMHHACARDGQPSSSVLAGCSARPNKVGPWATWPASFMRQGIWEQRPVQAAHDNLCDALTPGVWSCAASVFG